MPVLTRTAAFSFSTPLKTRSTENVTSRYGYGDDGVDSTTETVRAVATKTASTRNAFWQGGPLAGQVHASIVAGDSAAMSRAATHDRRAIFGAWLRLSTPWWWLNRECHATPPRIAIRTAQKFTRSISVSPE